MKKKRNIGKRVLSLLLAMTIILGSDGVVYASENVAEATDTESSIGVIATEEQSEEDIIVENLETSTEEEIAESETTETLKEEDSEEIIEEKNTETENDIEDSTETDFGEAIGAQEEIVLTSSDMQISFEETGTMLALGDKVEAPVYTITGADENTSVVWSSSNDLIVSISNENNIPYLEANAAGRAVITVAVEGQEDTVYAIYYVDVKPKTVTWNTTTDIDYKQISLSWNQVDSAQGYVIYRKAATESEYTEIVKIDDNTTTTYQDSDSILTGTEYTYKIYSYVTYEDAESTAYIYSDDSTEVSVTPSMGQTTGVTAKSASYNSIKLSWKTVSGASGYEIYRSTKETSGFKKIATVTSLSYTDKNLVTGTTYYYRVKVYRTINDENVYGIISDTESAKPVPETTTLKIESSNYESVSLSWTEVSDVSGYVLYRRVVGTDSYEKIANLKSGSTLSYQDTTVGTGTNYEYRIRAYCTVDSAKVYGSYSNTVTIEPSLKKTTVELTDVTYNSVNVNWTKVSGAEGYAIYRSTSQSGSYEKIATIKNGSTISYKDTGVTVAKTYYYKVKAYRMVDGNKVYAQYSTVVSELIRPAATTLATSGIGYDYIRLKWNAVGLPSASQNCGYYIYENINGTMTIIAEYVKTSKGYDLYKYTDGTRNAKASLSISESSSFTYKVSGLTHDNSYKFKIVAYANGVLGASSNKLTAEPKLTAPIIKTVAAKNYQSIVVSWTMTGDEEDGYIIYRKKSGDSGYTEIARMSATEGVTSYTYTDKTVETGTEYYYKIKSVKENGSDVAYSKNSTGVSCVARPAIPTLSVSASSYTGLTISWTKVKGTASNGYVDGYVIYRSTSKNGTYKKIATIENGKTVSYTDSGLKTGTTYYYKIRSYCNIDGDKIYSNYSSVESEKVVPAEASLSSVTSVNYKTLALTWEKVVGADGYAIYQSTSKGGNYEKIAVVKSGSTVTYTDTGLTTGKKYYYRIRAYKEVNGSKIYGSYSDIMSAKPKLEKVSGVKLTPKNANRITLSWNSVSGAKTYNIYRCTSKDGTYQLIESGVTDTTYTDTNLRNGKTYYYRIAAVRGSNIGSKSSKKAATAATLDLNATSVTIQQGFTETITASTSPSNTISWSSSNSGIATVTSDGAIYGVAPGSATITVKANGITRYINVTVKQTLNGIDVSKWQGDIDFNAVKIAGIDFVMMRIYSGVSEDPYFETYYTNAKAAGLKVGVYAYTYAKSVEAAQQDANTVLSLLNGRSLDFPVAYDMEDNSILTATDNTTRTNMAWTFYSTIVNSGYTAALYANLNWLNNYFDNARLAGMNIWIARYRDPNLGHGYEGAGSVIMWQYSSTGSVSGINGNVDLDFKFQ